METKDARIKDILVIVLSGRLDANSAEAFQEQLLRSIESGETPILLDLVDLEYVSSAGLRILLATAKRLTGSGGDLRICGLNEAVNEVFEISGFSTILDVFSSQEEALRGF